MVDGGYVCCEGCQRSYLWYSVSSCVKERNQVMSAAKRLAVIAKSAQKARITVNEIPSDMQIDMAGIRALSDEMRDRIGRNTTARNASVRSAASTTTGW